MPRSFLAHTLETHVTPVTEKVMVEAPVPPLPPDEMATATFGAAESSVIAPVHAYNDSTVTLCNTSALVRCVYRGSWVQLGPANNIPQ